MWIFHTCLLELPTINEVNDLKGLKCGDNNCRDLFVLLYQGPGPHAEGW